MMVSPVNGIGDFLKRTVSSITQSPLVAPEEVRSSFVQSVERGAGAPIESLTPSLQSRMRKSTSINPITKRSDMSHMVQPGIKSTKRREPVPEDESLQHAYFFETKKNKQLRQGLTVVTVVLGATALGFGINALMTKKK